MFTFLRNRCSSSPEYAQPRPAGSFSTLWPVWPRWTCNKNSTARAGRDRRGSWSSVYLSRSTLSRIIKDTRGPVQKTKTAGDKRRRLPARAGGDCGAEKRKPLRQDTVTGAPTISPCAPGPLLINNMLTLCYDFLTDKINLGERYASAL